MIMPPTTTHITTSTVPPTTPPIKKIILTNIQSLKKAEIEPAPPGQLCVVIGPSDTGKTTLASRALEKLFFNTIPTKEIVRRNTKQASITAIYDTPDNLCVMWRWKGRKTDTGKAWYEIHRDNMEPVIVQGSNRQGHVPEAIQQITGVRPVKIGNMTLNFNFNRQLNGPFLGGISPTERYRVLGALAGTLEVDEAIKEVGLELLRSRRREKELTNEKGTGEIDKLEQRIAEYGYLEDLARSIADVEVKVAEVQRKQELRERLEIARNDICDQTVAVASNEAKVDYLNDLIEKANSILTKIEASIYLYQKLNDLAGRIQIANTTLDVTRGVLSKTDDLEKIHLHLQATEEQHKTFAALEKLRQQINTEQQKLNTAEQVLNATRDTEKAAEAIESIAKANHTRGQLASLYVGLSAARGDIERHNDILQRTTGVNEATTALNVITDTAKDIKRLRQMRALMCDFQKDIDTMESVLEATKNVDKAKQALKQVIDNVGIRKKLAQYHSPMLGAHNTVTRTNKQIKQLTAEHDRMAEEYRALLLEAGICENCPVVDAVMAAS